MKKFCLILILFVSLQNIQSNPIKNNPIYFTILALCTTSSAYNIFNIRKNCMILSSIEDIKKEKDKRKELGFKILKSFGYTTLSIFILTSCTFYKSIFLLDKKIFK
jgi:hypothetical protein